MSYQWYPVKWDGDAQQKWETVVIFTNYKRRLEFC